MKRDLVAKINSSFASCDKDTEEILKKLFMTSQPYSNKLKKLLVVNARDCLTNPKYEHEVDKLSVDKLVEEGYIRIAPKIKMPEHEYIKSYIIITYDNFTPNKKNPKYRDCTINIDILCHTDYWDLGDFKVRPITIMGYIDGLLNEQKFSGIGTLNLLGANLLLLDNNLSGYTLTYRAIHGGDDIQEEGTAFIKYVE